MEILIEAIKEVNPNISDDALEIGLKKFELQHFKPKDLILEEGKICDYLLLPVSSITRCFYKDHEGTEQTLWMKPEQTFITEYKSFVHQAPSQFSLQFYEETECFTISRFDLLELYQKHSDWALFGVFLTEKVHITLIDVFVNLLANDATRNYQYIEYAFPRFIQVAPLKDIASMLQISPVSLSRIRAGKQTKERFS
ncbi:MAG: Crp/Fnr family transcriptional regulator [Bacteroidia bacterium]